MKDKKFIMIIFSMIIFFICIIGMYKVYGSKEVKVNSNEYVEKYFDKSKVMEINIEIDENELDEMLENAQSEKAKMASVTINGDKYTNVAVRPKGNSSLKAVASSNANNSQEKNNKSSQKETEKVKGKNRYSFKIDFDEYINGQTMGGLTQLNLNNNYSDPTYMREFIGYSICKDMGLKAPEMAYAKVSINGKYHGLYLAVESVLEPFIENNFDSVTGDLYKSTGTQGGTLKYNGDDFKNYSSIEVKSDRKNADETKLTKMMKALESGKDIEKYLDVDSALKYIALNTALLNLDSYQGSFAHNYYLYEQNGKFTVIPWDLNMAFGGFSGGGSSGQLIYIDEPTTGNVEDRPLVSKLLANEKYKAKYHKYLKEIVEKYLDSDYISNMTKSTHSLIASYVKEDPTAFYTYEEFEKNIKTSISDSNDDMPKNNTQVQNTKGNQLAQNNQEKPNMLRGKSLPGILELSQKMSKTIKEQLEGKIASAKSDSERVEVNETNIPNFRQGGQEPPTMPNPPEGMDGGKMPNIPEEGMPNKMQNQGQGNKGEIINKDVSLDNSSKVKISIISIITMIIAILGVFKFKRRRFMKAK